MSISGTVHVAGAAAAGARVLSFAGDPPRLRELAETDPDGSFSLGGGDGPLTLLACATQPGIAIACASLPHGDGDVDVAAEGELVEVEVTVEGPGEHPPRLRAFADPVSLPGVPERMLSFVTQTAPGAFAAHLWEAEIPDPQFTLRLQAGVWRIGAAFIVYERPMIRDPDFVNYVATAARSDPGGAQLPGNESRGFELTVEPGVRAVLELRAVRDDEL